MTRLGLLLVALAAPAAAHAQGAHPLPAAAPPLDERVRAADAVVFATVDAVSEDRIRLREVVPVLGDVPPRIEVKRSPSHPPRVEPGGRVLLLLLGARSPYTLPRPATAAVLVREPVDEARWREALRALAEVAERPEARRRIYLSWIAGGDPSLAALGREAVLHPARLLEPIPDGEGETLARWALDDGRPEGLRAAAAELAVRSAAGRAWLLEQTGDLAGLPAGVASVVLRTARAVGDPRLAEHVRSALSHPDAGVRRNALRAARNVPLERVADAVGAAAASDPDARVRREAARLLAGDTRRRHP